MVLNASVLAPTYIADSVTRIRHRALSQNYMICGSSITWGPLIVKASYVMRNNSFLLKKNGIDSELLAVEKENISMFSSWFVN